MKLEEILREKLVEILQAMFLHAAEN